MFNAENVGFVKVAYVADYGNHWVVPRMVEKGRSLPSAPKRKRSINPVQAKALTQEWAKDGKKYSKRTGKLFLDVPY